MYASNFVCIFGNTSSCTFTFFVAIIYWSLNKSAGIKIAMGYSCAYSINQTIKNIACVPRPWILDSRLKVDSLAEGGATGYSFPSGHTVTAASVFGGVAAWQKKRPFIVVLMAIFTLLVAFSRNWLGCHTLKDVIVTGANDVYVVENEDGKELLFPAIKECVLNVDVEQAKITVHIMPGLLD